MEKLAQHHQHFTYLPPRLRPFFKFGVWQFIRHVTVVAAICLFPLHLSANETVDTDGDGIENSTDLDDDNDGIPDELENIIVEMSAPIPMPGAASSNVEYDAAVDVDSDKDHVSDTIEFWGITANFDNNNDGQIDDFVDTNLNGWHDAFETLPLIPKDTDNDGWPDYLDRDSDNDGLWDFREAFAENYNATYYGSRQENTLDGFSAVQILDSDQDGVPDMLEVDSDNDYVPDAVEAQISVDANNNGIPNHREDDSDGDGISDTEELNATTNDSDGDGIVNTFDADFLGHEDRDEDGISDQLMVQLRNSLVNIDEFGWTPDADGDYISDFAEWGADPDNPRDTDSDGIPDYLDEDSDDDGIRDSTESNRFSSSCFRVCINYATHDPRDYDGDGLPNYIDLDSDNDSIPDSVEAGAYNTNLDSKDYLDPNILQTGFIDSDRDGIIDIYESKGDSDGDGVPDYLDRDSDNDGLLDAEERLDSKTDGFPDTDGDGITDQLDIDSDQDGLTDTFETLGMDVDGDGRIDGFTDTDGDGANDATSGALDQNDADPDNQKAYLGPPHHKDLDSDKPDFDAENNGYIDVLLVPGEFNQFRDDDGDGIYNHLDLDSDADGESDLASSGAEDINDDGVVDFWTDTDGDGLSDWVDADMGPRADHDNDGIANLADFSCFRAAAGEGYIDRDLNGIIDGYGRTSIRGAEINVGFGLSHWEYGEMETHTFRAELGYVHMFQPTHLVEEFDQFDANRNCIADAEEVSVANEIMAESASLGDETEVFAVTENDPPEAAAPPVLGAAHASGSGGGCSISGHVLTVNVVGSKNIDPTLPVFIIISGMWLFSKRNGREEILAVRFYLNGLTSETPVFAESFSSRVTNVREWKRAVSGL